MRRIYSLVLFAICTFPLMAGNIVKVTISGGIDNAVVKAKMENAMSSILSEANSAQKEGRQMNYSLLDISSEVQDEIAALWANSPFMCIEENIVEKCITTQSGYQVRNIPLVLKPVNSSDVSQDEEYQEAVINFDKQGNVTSFLLAISNNLYMKVLKDNKGVTDSRRRQIILDYVEQFRTSYNQKDINFLENVFSEDALIITGRVIKRKANDGIPLPDKIVYNKLKKEKYLANLRTVFSKNKYIHVTFDEVEVVRHPKKTDFYGVTLHQGWTSDRYHDDGYVFLLWDFRDETHPQIHVRTWQPYAYNKDGKGIQHTPKEEIFSLFDFNELFQKEE